MKAKASFSSIIKQFEFQFDLRTVFNDFLVMSLCAVTQNLHTKKSYYEDEYLLVVAKYKHSTIRHEFSNLFAQLILEMEERHDSASGNDVLGEFYEQHLYRKGTSQYFTPQPICEFMAQCAGDSYENGKSFNILDPSCGSGRILLSSSRALGKGNHFFGIDIDLTCVQMTALNFFLNGLFDSEVMWGNALDPNDFRLSYSISLLPLGIFRIEDKRKSKLWQMHQNSFFNQTKPVSFPIEFTDKISQMFQKDNSQLNLF